MHDLRKVLRALPCRPLALASAEQDMEIALRVAAGLAIFMLLDFFIVRELEADLSTDLSIGIDLASGCLVMGVVVVCAEAIPTLMTQAIMVDRARVANFMFSSPGVKAAAARR